MSKAGLIGIALSFVLSVIAALIAPFCGLCVGVVVGLVAGYLSGVFDRPMTVVDAVRTGAAAGGIASVGALVGQLLAAAGLATFFPEGSQLAAEIVADIQGIPAPELTSGFIWAQQLAIGCCVGLLNVGVLTLFGIGGGLLWRQIRGENEQPQMV